MIGAIVATVLGKVPAVPVWLAFALIIAFSIVAASVNYHLFERPITTFLKRYLPDRPSIHLADASIGPIGEAAAARAE
jgi:peptidoglycan/LPS O-acetylase OafA/YrhL